MTQTQNVAGYSNLCVSTQTHRKACLCQLQTLTQARDGGDVHIDRWGVTAEIAFLVHLLAFCLHTWTPGYYWLINSSALPAHIKHIKDN